MAEAIDINIEDFAIVIQATAEDAATPDGIVDIFKSDEGKLFELRSGPYKGVYRPSVSIPRDERFRLGAKS